MLNKKLLTPILIVGTILIAIFVWANIGTNNDVSKTKTASAPDKNDIPISVISVAERSFDNKPALAVLMSTPLDPKQRYDKYIKVLKKTKTGPQNAVGGWVLSDNGRILYFPHIIPQTKYSVRIERGLPAANKSALTAIKEYTVTTRKVSPYYAFASKGSILPKRSNDGLPIVTVNTPEVHVQFFRVEPKKITQFLYNFNNPGKHSYYSLDNMRKYTKPVYTGRYRTLSQANRRTVTNLPVHNVKQLRKPGLYLAILSRPDRFDYYYKTSFFLVTDIGMHARVYEKELHVYASSLNTGKNLADVKLKLYNRHGHIVEEVFTDNKGKARFKFMPNRRSAIIAERGGEIAIISFKDPALDLSEFKIRGKQHKPLETFVYSNRDLFRPGERVNFSLLLRNQDGKSSKAIPLHIKIKRPDGRIMRKLSLRSRKTGKLGYYYHRFQIPSKGQTGKWSLEVRVNPAAKIPNHIYKFNVEEFLPERMKLDLASTRDFLTPGETFKVNVDGAYLYGAPAAGNRVTAVLNRYPNHYPLKNLPKFYFGDVNESNNKTRTELLDSKLDKNGKYVIKIKPDKTKHHSPFSSRVTTSIFESGGRPVTRSIKRIVWPAKSLIGVRPLYSGKNATENSVVEFEVIKVLPDGKRVEANNLGVKLIREERNYFWTWSSRRGWHYEHSTDQYPVVVSSLAFTAIKNGKLSMPVKWGSYRLEITDPLTSLTMRHRFYAGYNWNARGQANSARPTSVGLTLNKKAYRSGDKVKLQVIAPHAGKAVIMVESNKLLWSKTINIGAKVATTVDFKIATEWANRHDLYVSTIVYRPGESAEKLTPNRAVGLVHLPLERDHRKLDVAINMPKKMQPGRDLKVKIKIANLRNQKAMVTVSAVDLGILNITDFPTPDPFAHFFAKRSYGVRQYDAYHKVIENLSGVRAKLRFGGDAPGNGNQSKKADAKVKTVALFSGAVKVNDKGEATIKLAVPDYNGSLRVMAVAFSKDRFGSKDQEITVAAPVIAEIATPRFISPGDQSTLTMDLHNLSGENQKLKVDLQVSKPLKLERFRKSISLADKKKTIIRFKLGAHENFGVGKIFLTVKGKGVDLKRSWELGVRPPFPGVRRVEYKIIKPGTGFTLNRALHSDLMSETVDGTLVVSTVPPLNVRGAVKGLLSYPYGCLEQTTSRAFPIVYIDQQKALKVGLKPLSNTKRNEYITKALVRIRSMQLGSGGFGLWNNRSREEPWLTPYVVHFMLEARDQGYSVPDDMLKKALRNLELRLGKRRRIIAQYFYTQSPDHLFFAADAYAAYVLARVQRAPLGTLRTLYDHHRKNSKSGLPLVHLGLALKLMGDSKRGLAAIKAGVKLARKENLYLGDYGSVVRDTALIVALINHHKLSIPNADKLVFDLSRDMRGRNYLSTQEQLAVFMASHELSKGAGTDWKGTLVHQNKSVDINRKGKYINAFTANDLNAGVRFKTKGAKNLYAMYVVNGYPRQSPKAITKHINVVRTLYNMKGKAITDRNFKVGQLLIAHISVRSKKRTDNALVVDLLPAGFEIENLNISKGEDLGKIKIQGKNPQKVMSNNSIKHQEYRDDRFVAAVKLSNWKTTDLFYLIRVVSPGTYRVPPVLVEDMYRPDWRGIGTTDKNITVLNVSH